jgi:zinc protease
MNAGKNARAVVVAAIAGVACAHHPADQPAPSTTPLVSAPSQARSLTVPPPTAQASAAAHVADLAFWNGRPDLIQPPPPPPAGALNLSPVDRWQLKNGLNVLAVPRRGLPIVSISIAIEAGGYDEVRGRNEGVADVVAAMLRKGTQKRSADQIAEAIDRVGGALDAGAAKESSTVSCSVLAKDAALCLDLLAEMLMRPTFPDAELPEIRDQVLAGIAARVDDPHLLAAEHFNNLLFGDTHPDGWVLTEEQVRAITRKSLVAFWDTFYRPNNALLAVAGDFDVAAMKASVARAFGAWKSGAVPLRGDFHIPVTRGTRVVLVDKPDLSQATLMFGHRGIRHGDADWYAATLVNYVLGGSDFSSRLMTEVRSNRGLTYGIGSSYGAPLYQGAFRVSAATRNETAGDALTVSLDQLRLMKASGPTAIELSKAKGYYAGSTPFELESAAGVARRIVAAELHALGIEYVRQLPLRLAAVDVAAAAAAAHAHLEPDGLAIVIVGRGSAIEGQLRKAGLPFERVDYRAPISAAARRAKSAPPPAVTPGATPPAANAAPSR